MQSRISKDKDGQVDYAFVEHVNATLYEIAEGNHEIEEWVWHVATDDVMGKSEYDFEFYKWEDIEHEWYYTDDEQQ